MGGIMMNEITFVLSSEQLVMLQAQVHDIVKDEVGNFRSELGLHMKYLKKRQVCDYLNLSNNTVDKLIADGMPTIKVQGIVLYDKTEIDDWLKSHRYSKSKLLAM